MMKVSEGRNIECKSGEHLLLSGPPLQELATFERLSDSMAPLKVLVVPLVSEAIDLLAAMLPGDLVYHNIGHTIDVIELVVRLASLDGLPPRDRELLAIAAAWHDVGYLVQRNANEPIGAEMARVAMERSRSYTPTETADVIAAILDTAVAPDAGTAALVQKARGRLSPWLLDADLGNFGRPCFLRSSLKVFQELSGVEVRAPEDIDQQGIAFLASTVRMLGAHTYQTSAAIRLLGAQKAMNCNNVGYLLAQLIGGNDVSRENAWKIMMP